MRLQPSSDAILVKRRPRVDPRVEPSDASLVKCADCYKTLFSLGFLVFTIFSALGAISTLLRRLLAGDKRRVKEDIDWRVISTPNLHHSSLYLKWAWSILLHHSFFNHHLRRVPQELIELGSHGRCGLDLGSFELVECSVCLSTIGEDEEIKVLRCGHLFHRVCLDQWLEIWNTTCPLCRDCLVSAQVVSEIGNEFLVFDYFLTSNSQDEGYVAVRVVVRIIGSGYDMKIIKKDEDEDNKSSMVGNILRGAMDGIPVYLGSIRRGNRRRHPSSWVDLRAGHGRGYGPREKERIKRTNVHDDPRRSKCKRYPRPHWAQTNPRQFLDRSPTAKACSPGSKPPYLQNVSPRARTRKLLEMLLDKTLKPRGGMLLTDSRRGCQMSTPSYQRDLEHLQCKVLTSKKCSDL
ncbi:hypothetical protein OSB04_019708 [Centaurea solstitialis]|uniref:RING-type domain-containing protein n=1 Tax=Centaurea solstitialis TaxID=347529 RepID=A0AA38T333_9ASTR|nr:hypothetical protein OSB04_019708 [Centaurea solstitialis]